MSRKPGFTDRKHRLRENPIIYFNVLASYEMVYNSLWLVMLQMHHTIEWKETTSTMLPDVHTKKILLSSSVRFSPDFSEGTLTSLYINIIEDNYLPKTLHGDDAPICCLKCQTTLWQVSNKRGNLVAIPVPSLDGQTQTYTVPLREEATINLHSWHVHCSATPPTTNTCTIAPRGAASDSFIKHTRCPASFPLSSWFIPMQI